MIFKKTLMALSMTTIILSINANAANINNILGDFLGGIFSALDKSSSQSLSMCYTPKSNFGLDSSGDICSIVNKLPSMDVCSLVPEIPGFRKKSQSVSLSGLRQLCKTNTKAFSDISSSALNNVAENVIDNSTGEISETTKLPNGKTVGSFVRSWNINNFVKEQTGKTNFVETMLSSNNNQALRLAMDYSKSAEASGKEPGDISSADIKAPKTLEDYRKGRQELAKSFYSASEDVSASSISGGASLKVKGKKGKEAQSAAREYLTSKEDDFNMAKANEIGNALSVYNANRPGNLAIPTQEYVDILRQDLQPTAVAQIRKQQLEEAEIIARITEKWDRKKAIAALVADKEVIMNEEFDNEAAQKEIDQIVSSASSGSNGANSGTNTP
ncbi:hypothetical protein ACMWEF_001575 [Campylobacter jejuni]|nr:hypothetical protein [Campylobacter jejuni]ECP7577839.1 hypothetical protein [Campylobacter jejuni]EEP3556536.1 hypothetical protein [Campylobacter jejuni]EGA8608698.1 hypothetical protein [Campylobacter jejuni]EGA8646418.1 hypothetical protein [Campylobacter jejuni]